MESNVAMPRFSSMPRTSSTSTTAVWEWAQTALLVANLAWTTLCLGGFLAASMVLSVSLTAALALVHGVGWFLCVRTPHQATGAVALALERRVHPAGFFFIPFLGYAAANAAWVTPVPWLGWLDWYNWVQLWIVFWVVLNGIRSDAAQRVLIGTLLALALVAVAMAGYQRYVQPGWLMLGRVQVEQYGSRASGCFGIPNSFAAFLLLILPLTGALTVRRSAGATSRVFFGWLALVLVFGLALSISRGAWLGLALAVAAWPVLASRASWRRRLLLACAAFASIVLVGGLGASISPRFRERFSDLIRDAGERSRPILWRAGWSIFTEHPVLGGGAGSFNVLFEKHRPEGFLHEPRWAHNDYLNTLSDHGAVGFLLLFGAAAGVAVRCMRSGKRVGSNAGAPKFGVAGGLHDALDDRLVRQSLGIGLLAFALQLFVDFHFKLPALGMAFSVVAALAVGRSWRVAVRDTRSSSVRLERSAALGAAVCLCGIAVALAVWMLPQFRGEAAREQARRAIDKLAEEAESSPRFQQQIAFAREELARAVVLSPRNAQAWSDRSYATAQWSKLEPGRIQELGREAEGHASRAIEIAPVLAEPWIRRGVSRDMQARWQAAGEDFTQAILLSPKTVLPWYHYAYHTSLLPNGRGMAEALAAFCLRLDPSDTQAQRLRQRLATGQLQP